MRKAKFKASGLKDIWSRLASAVGSEEGEVTASVISSEVEYLTVVFPIYGAEIPGIPVDALEIRAEE